MIVKASILAAVLMATAAGAHAGEFKAASHGSYLIDLDTQDGNFALWRTEDVGDINALRAHITLARKGSGKYLPVVTLRIGRGDKSVMLQLAAFPKSGPLVGFVQDGEKKDDPNQQLIMLAPEFQEPFDVHVRWTPEGKVSFDIYDKANKAIGQGFEHHEIDLGGAPTSVEITNSTGEVEFNKLELGTETP
jgi:hypothetical protein